MLLKQDTCDNCMALYYPKAVDQRFCQARCLRRYNARQSGRGRILVEHAMLWRLSRKGFYLTEISRLIDKWLEEDRKRLGDAYADKRLKRAEIRRDLGRVLSVDL